MVQRVVLVDVAIYAADHVMTLGQLLLYTRWERHAFLVFEPAAIVPGLS